MPEAHARHLDQLSRQRWGEQLPTGVGVEERGNPREGRRRGPGALEAEQGPVR